MTPPSLFEQFEHLGQWWPPQSPKERLSGVLTVSRGEGRLVLMGILPGGAGLLKTRTPFVPNIIHGETGNGTEITLYHTPEFWRRLERVMPDYEARRQRLAVEAGLN